MASSGAFMSPVHEIYYTVLRRRTYIIIILTARRGPFRKKVRYSIIVRRERIIIIYKRIIKIILLNILYRYGRYIYNTIGIFFLGIIYNTSRNIININYTARRRLVCVYDICSPLKRTLMRQISQWEVLRRTHDTTWMALQDR